MNFRLARHDFFFWAGAFFLLGVLLGSLTAGLPFKFFWILAVTAFLTMLLYWRDKQWNFLIFFILAGAIYLNFYQYFYQKSDLPLDQFVKITGLIEKADQTIDRQEILARDQKSLSLVKAIIFRYPNYHYGDLVVIEGKTKKSRSPFYQGLMFYPKINLVSSGNGWRLKTRLLNFKNQFQENLKKVLPYDKAVFLSGLTVGGRSEFSRELSEKFNLSGTTHLVALSGMNISIIVGYAAIFFGFFFSRRWTLPATVIFILLFVLMAGGEASIVRAAIMALIVVLAKSSGRNFSIRNGLMAAALVMILFDPRALVWDLSFQLSFAALMGIVYIKPWLERKFKLDKIERKSTRGFIKDAILVTISAELAVFPLLLLRLGRFSPWGLIANPLIEFFIPATMVLGFLTGLLGFISYHFSFLAAGLVNILLTYELAIIDLFSQ